VPKAKSKCIFLNIEAEVQKKLAKIIVFFTLKRYKNGSETAVGVRAIILCRL
jgi:hypothetical protein